MTECFLKAFTDVPCEGQLVRAHLIPKQTIRKEFPKGAFKIDGVWISARRADHLEGFDPDFRTTAQMQDDYRSWVPACGGICGISGHHGMLDGYRLQIPRGWLPGDVEEYAQETGLGWYLDRTYGELEAAA